MTDHVLALPAIPEPKLSPSLVSPTGGQGEDNVKLVGMGEAIRLVLFEQMRSDERIRVLGRNVADADEEIIASVAGKGGVFGTTRGLPTRVRCAALLQRATCRSQHHGRRGVGQAITWTSAVYRDSVLRLHLARDRTDPSRGGHDEVALRRTLPLSRWSSRTRSAAT